MPGGGSKPGERRGGRQKGSPGRATIAIEEVAKKHGLIVRPGQKLVKDDMIKVFEICLGMAARYQPSAAPGGLEMATAKQLAEFKEWIRISIEAGKAVMPYQSPTFKAIMVSQAGSPNDAEPAKHPSAEIVPLNDAVGASRVYRRIVAAGGER